MRLSLLPPVALLLASLVAGCGLTTTNDTGLYLIDAPQVDAKLRNRLGRVELREVALPQYAAGQEIVRQGADGALRSGPSALWADAPARGVTQFLASQISTISGATALAEPWPLAEAPARRLRVRFERIFAGNDGMFHLEGQYFVAPTPAEEGRDIVRRFRIAEPLGGDDPAAVAAAQSRALQGLARQIAALD